MPNIFANPTFSAPMFESKPQPPLVVTRHPMVMHKGQYPSIKSRIVQTPEEELKLLTEGWSTERPAMPEPTPEFVVPRSTDERVSNLEADVAEIKEALTGSEEPAPVSTDYEKLSARVLELEAAIEELKQRRGPGRPPLSPNKEPA